MAFLNEEGLDALVDDIKANFAALDSNGAVLSSGADYAEYGDWDDGNPRGEDRKGYFVTIVNGTDNITKATADSAIIGVTTSTAGFIGNYSDGAEADASKGLVGIVGQVSVIDNGTCTVGQRCMPSDGGTATPSANTCGYKVIERIDATHVKIMVAPSIDMIQRIKTDVSAIETKLSEQEEATFSGDWELLNSWRGETKVSFDLTGYHEIMVRACYWRSFDSSVIFPISALSSGVSPDPDYRDVYIGGGASSSGTYTRIKCKLNAHEIVTSGYYQYIDGSDYSSSLDWQVYAR